MNIDDLIVMFVTLMGVALIVAMLLLIWIVWRVRRIQLPPGADVIETLQMTPLAVVVLLDLLDLGLDFLSAPFSWVLLTWLGLEPLRVVAVVKDLIPMTQFIPAMTAAWVLARVIGPRRPAIRNRPPEEESAWRVTGGPVVEGRWRVVEDRRRLGERRES